MSTHAAVHDPHLSADWFALLRDTDWPITDIAFQTGWRSLGTFGRIFRDINGVSPGEFRAAIERECDALAAVPHCVLSAAHRPDLSAAVSEKRRQAQRATKGSPNTERDDESGHPGGRPVRA